MTAEEYNISVDEHADGIYRFVLKNLKDDDRARDIVQDAYEKLWMKKENVSFYKVKSYLFTTAYHTMIDVIRKDKRQTDFEEINPNLYTDENKFSDLNEVLHKALEKLPEVQKSVILLRDYEGYSYQEIAEICELTESQVKVYIYRGRKFLKEFIGNIGVLIWA